jgi:hypothetical protein
MEQEDQNARHVAEDDDYPEDSESDSAHFSSCVALLDVCEGSSVLP